MDDFILTFNHISNIDKNYLGKEIIEQSTLEHEGIIISPSIILTNSALLYFLKQQNILETLNNEKNIKKIKTIFHDAKFPENLAKRILAHYHKLAGAIKESELKLTPFIIYGDHEKELNSTVTKGEANLVLEIKEVWREFLENNYVTFENNFTDNRPKIVILIQKKPKLDLKGEIYTSKFFRNRKVIEIILTIKGKNKKIILDKQNEEIIEGEQLKIYKKYLNQIFNTANKIDKLLYLPKKCDFYIEKNKLFITQILDDSSFSKTVVESEKEDRLILSGENIKPGLVSGKAVVFNHKINQAKNILILDFFGREDLKYFKNALGLVLTKKENISLLENLQLPIIFSKEAKNKIKNEDLITINGTTGEIFKGGYIHPKIIATNNYKTATKILVNLNDENISDLIRNFSDGIFYESTFQPVSHFENLSNNVNKKIIYSLISDDTNLEKELKIIKLLRNKNRLNNISISISNANTIDEIINNKKIIAANGLYRSHTFEEFLKIKTISECESFTEILNLNFDGIIFDLKTLTNYYFGEDLEILKDNPEFENFILETIKHFSKDNLKLFIDLTKVSISHYFLNKLITIGLTGFLVNKSDFIDKKTKIRTIEKKLLE